ncbi:MAG: GNAT family protein [Gilvibacter sp.]
MAGWFKEISLEGNLARLIPLQKTHKDGLLKAASDGALWQLWFTSVPSEKSIEAYIDSALAQKEKGLEYPFVVLNKADNKIIGCTRYYGATPQHRRLEIGYTWYAKSYQRTGVNTECKLLLLAHAFEKMNCIAVQFMTSAHNQASRAAITRIGAKQDGILRNHRLHDNGTYRDSVVFSITDNDWPAVKKDLTQKLSKHTL